MNERNRQQMVDQLLLLIQKIENQVDSKEVFGDLMTSEEFLAVAQRLEAAMLLKKKAPFSEIVAKTEINAYAVAKIQSLLRNANGFDKAAAVLASGKEYTSLAQVYDQLTQDVAYDQRLAYIQQLFQAFDCSPKLVLDLACGTGTMTTLLAKAGYDMTGVDDSAEMLDEARKKAREQSLDILYLNQSMQEFELYGSVDAVLCLLDGLNYLTEDGDLEQTFALVENYLEPGGLFIFDLNTKYKMEYILAGNVFCGSGDNSFYTWESVFDPEAELAEYTLNLFVREQTLYRRFTEYHYQRAYGKRKVLSALKRAGLEFLAEYDDLTFTSPSRSSEKVFYVAKKREACHS